MQNEASRLDKSKEILSQYFCSDCLLGKPAWRMERFLSLQQPRNIFAKKKVKFGR